MPKQALWLYAARGLAMASGLLSQLVFARIGGQDGYGVFSTLLSIVLVFNTVSDFGINLNGPRKILAGDNIWVQQAQFTRMLLGGIGALVMAVVLWVYYQPYFYELSWGIPLVFFNGLQIDWIFRGNNKHMISAFRQMTQSVLALSLLFLTYKMHWDIATGIGLYAFSGLLSYALYYSFAENWKTIKGNVKSSFQLLKVQWVVFSGSLAHQLTYSIPTLVLLPLAGSAATGHFASHYLLFTSLAGFSVITMDIFMSRPGFPVRNYMKWMFVFSLPALLGLAVSGWYYPLLFAEKGFLWDANLSAALILLVLIHAGRLIWLNGLLMNSKQLLYQRFSMLGLSIHIILWLFWLIADLPPSPLLAISFLLLSELPALLILALKKKPSNDARVG